MSTGKLKVGLDIHGVIDTYPEKFRLLSRALVRDGAEVHIVTGVKRDSRIDQLLADAGIEFTHYFSIVEELESRGANLEWRDGLPYAKDEEWNVAKRDYCKAQEISLMLDDSPIYLETFREVDTTYLHVINH